MSPSLRRHPLSENFVEIGHFQRNFDKVFRQRATTKLGTSRLGQALASRGTCQGSDRVVAALIFVYIPLAFGLWTSFVDIRKPRSSERSLNTWGRARGIRRKSLASPA